MTKPGLSTFVVKQCLSEVVTELTVGTLSFPVCLQQHIDDKAKTLNGKPVMWSRTGSKNIVENEQAAMIRE